MNSSQIIEKYIGFFETRGHKRIPNSPLVPQNDPTTLFTSAGMQPLIPFLLGQDHPEGKRLVNVQNSLRAQDIDEVGDNRHTTFFRMLGNWSLGDYFKNEEIPWLFEFLTKELGLDPKRLYVSVFEGYGKIPKDQEAFSIWEETFKKAEVETEGRIFFAGVEENWWSRSGIPDNMPSGEIGGPDTEVYFDLEPGMGKLSGSFKELSDSGRLLEIANSVFIQYQKHENGRFMQLPQRNVDFGGGLERLLMAVEDQPDVHLTSLFTPITEAVKTQTSKGYNQEKEAIRRVVDYFISAVFILANGITPSNKEQGYVLRRFLRRGFDEFNRLEGKNISKVIESIVDVYKGSDSILLEKFEEIKNKILTEEQKYQQTLEGAKKLIDKEIGGHEIGGELMGEKLISAETAFKAISSFGLSPTQLKTLGYSFNEQELAEKIKEHQITSRAGAKQRFTGGLADHSQKTVMGHTATHLLHQALRDVLGDSVHQTGSNITEERVRFDFNYDKPLTLEQKQKVEDIINEKIKENLPVHFEMMELAKAKEIGAIGLFDDKYQESVKVYFVGDYSKEFCGGPHVDFTGELKKVKIIKEESIGRGQRRIYAKVEA